MSQTSSSSSLVAILKRTGQTLRALPGRIVTRVESMSWGACLLLALGLGVSALAVGGVLAWVLLRPVPLEVVRPAGASPSIYEKNGMAFAGPYLTFHGSKPGDMSIEVWARYGSRSPNCRSADILECDERHWFTPGNPENKSMGIAKQQYWISRSTTEFTLQLPLAISNPWDCQWELISVQFYGRHHYTATNDTKEKRTDIIELMTPPPDAPPYASRPLRERYEVYCQKQKYREIGEPDYYRLECQFPGQKAQGESINRDVLENDHDVWLDIILSEDVKIMK